jgi:hypothetical protein
MPEEQRFTARSPPGRSSPAIRGNFRDALLANKRVFWYKQRRREQCVASRAFFRNSRRSSGI